MYRLPAAPLWILVFAAVLGHLPGLGFEHARPDFLALARAAGLENPETWNPRPWTDFGVWTLWWRVAGVDASIPHGFAALLVAANAVLIAIAGARIGIPRAGAILAAVLWLLGPHTGLAVASTTASGDLWALGFALGALVLWLGPSARRDPPLAALLLVGSLASGGAALLLAPVFGLATRYFGNASESRPVRSGRAALLWAIAAVALVAWFGARDAVESPTLALASRAGSGPGLVLHQLGAAAWPWPAAPGQQTARILGGIVAIALLGLLVRIRQRPAPRVRWCAAWVAASLAPALLLPSLERETGALATAVGLAWLAGTLLGPGLERVLDRARRRFRIADALALVAVLLLAGPAWGALRSSALHRVDPSGRFAHPALHEAAVAGAVRRQVDAVLSGPAPPPQIAFLQATRIQLPEDAPLPEDQEIIFTTPVHRALAGGAGPSLMAAGRATARWTTLLDQVSRDAFVFLDVGDDRVRPLGPVENARIYVAMIAVAAGQRDLARHELWSVIEDQGAEVRFAFDPDHLPITPSELDAEATGFATWLRADGTPASLRVLRLFASLYESVRGQALIEEGWGGPLRSGRVDD